MPLLDVFLTSKASTANYNIHVNKYQTTYADIGFQTYFKVDESETAVSGRTNHQAVLENCRIVTLIDNDPSSMYGNIIYKVTNFDQINHKISISTDADIAIAYNDYTNIRNIEGNKGFIMENNQLGFSPRLTYYLRDIGYENVDTYWYGYSKYRFDNLYKNRTSFDEYNFQDSGMAFSWKDIVIPPKQTKMFSVFASSSKDINLQKAPKIKAEIRSQGPYYKGFINHPNFNNKIIILAEIVSFEVQKKIKIKCNFNDVGPILMKEVVQENVPTQFIFNFTLPNDSYLFNGTNRMTIYCQDNNGRLSNFVNFDIEAIIEPIKLNISIAEHKSPYECKKDDKFTLSGWLNDLSGFGPVEIVALYNGNYEHVLKTYNDRCKEINEKVLIEANGLAEINNVSIFARNQCSGVSEMFNFTFGYNCKKPILNINVIYEKSELFINGSVSYKDPNDVAYCRIYYYFDGDDENWNYLLYTWDTFNKTMKPNIYDGKHKIYFYALDSHNIKSDIYSKEFTFASTVPIITLSKQIESNISETSNITLEGQLEYQSNCNMYYNIDDSAFISLGAVDVNLNRKIGSFRFNFTLNQILSEGVHNLTLYAASTTDNYIRSDNIIHKFTYFSSRPQIINFSKLQTISRAKFYFYHQYVTRGNMRRTKKV